MPFARRGELAECAESKPKPVSDDGDDDTDPSHFQTGCPPGTDRDQRFQCAHEKVCHQTDAKRNNHRGDSAREEERNDWNKSADSRGNASRGRCRPLIRKPMLGQPELTLRHRLYELLGLPGQTGNQNVMLLIVCRASYARNNSKYCAQSIICAIDRIGDPTAASAMPAFALQDFVECGTRANRRRHRAKRSRMRFFLDCAFPQKFLHILFAGQGTLSLVMKFGFLPFLCRFHPANSDFGSCNFVPPTAEPPADCVLQNRWLCSKVSEFRLPTVCMALFGFGHAQKNAFASLVPLAFGQIA